MPNPRVNPSHSVVTALAESRKRRAAARARQAHRWADKSIALTEETLP